MSQNASPNERNAPKRLVVGTTSGGFLVSALSVANLKTPPLATPATATATVTPPSPPGQPPPTSEPPPANPPSKIARLEVPDDDQLRAAIRQIMDVFEDEFKAARTPDEKQALARILLRQAQEDPDEPPVRFALFKLARDNAVEAGDIDAALRSVDALAKVFAIDGSRQKVDVLSASRRSATARAAAKALTDAALSVVDEALAADDYASAARAADIAATSARRVRDGDLVTAVNERRKEVEQLEEAWEDVREAFQTLETAPDDAASNVAAGMFLCLMRGNFERGLPMLARGENEPLAMLAQQDLAAPTDVMEQVKLGDAWWDLGEERKLLAKVWAQRRGRHWYALALPKLAGLDRTKVERRMEDERFDASGARVVNLMELIDVQRDVLRGEWIKDGKQLHCATMHLVPKVTIPYQPPEEYDFTVVFSQPKLRNPVIQVMPKNGSSFAWFCGGTRGRWGFTVDAQGGNPTERSIPGSFVPNQKYTSVVKVRNEGVAAYLNGKLVASYKTDFGDLKAGTWYQIRDRSLLAIGCDDPATYYKVELTEITGRGRKTR